MTKYKIILAYDGTNYHGWQIQPDRVTIQGVLEDALHRITVLKTRAFAAGRTDAGVHALGQVAHFEAKIDIKTDEWKKALNRYLPPDVRVLKVQKTNNSFHARKSAKSKWYRYTICLSEDLCVFDRNRKLLVGIPLHIRKMRQAAAQIIGKKDLSSFGVNPRRKDGKKDNPVKHFKRIKIWKKNGDLLIDLEASGFLYKMARSIVGTLLEVGKGKMPVSQLRDILQSKERRLAGPTVAPQGLCLMEVKY